MIRTKITPDKNSVVLPLPDCYVGKPIEIIAFALDEPIEQTQRSSAKKVFTILKVDTKGYKFDRDEANER